MAKPIPYTPKPKTPQEKYADAQFESAEALTEALKLLRDLHEAGVLDVLHKLTRGGEGLTAALLSVLNEDSSVKLIRNVSELGRTLSVLEPMETAQLGRAVAAGVRAGAQQVAVGKGLGLSDLLKLLGDRDVQLALGAVFGGLKGAGRALREARGETQLTPNQGKFDRDDTLRPTPNSPASKPSKRRR